MEEGDDPNFVSDTNNLITIKQKGPTLREIRDTDMGAAITYLLLDLEGVDTEPDILDDGKKGPWTIFARHALLFSPQRHPPKRGTPIHDRLAFYHNRLLSTQLQQRAPPF